MAPSVAGNLHLPSQSLSLPRAERATSKKFKAHYPAPRDLQFISDFAFCCSKILLYSFFGHQGIGVGPTGVSDDRRVIVLVSSTGEGDVFRRVDVATDCQLRTRAKAGGGDGGVPAGGTERIVVRDGKDAIADDGGAQISGLSNPHFAQLVQFCLI